MSQPTKAPPMQSDVPELQDLPESVADGARANVKGGRLADSCSPKLMKPLTQDTGLTMAEAQGIKGGYISNPKNDGVVDRR